MNRNFQQKSATSEYMIALSELNNIEEDEPEDELLLPMPTEAIFKAKSAIDEVLERYEMASTAVNGGIILHEAKSIGPVLAEELIEAISELSTTDSDNDRSFFDGSNH